MALTQQLNMTLDNLTSIGNVTEIHEFAINVNHTIYGGWLFFILLWVFWYILYRSMEERVEDGAVRALYASGACSILSILMRIVTVVQSGVVKGMLTDSQLWVFPLITIGLSWFLWSTKR